MGAWGEGLYDDDFTCDVRDSISMLSKMPATGDEIIKILTEQYGPVRDLADDGVPGFWMVVADQFSKKGIESKEAVSNALDAIDSGADIRDLQARGMEEKGLKSRLKVHAKLKDVIANPKPASKRRVAKSPPKLVVRDGEIFAYPTMNGKGLNAWFSNWEEAKFVPDGWGSMLITSTGREYEWFPWATYVPVNTDPAKKPTINDVLKAKTLLSDGAGYCIPKKSHITKMGMEKLGEVRLNQDAVEDLLKSQRNTAKQAVSCGWSICSGAFSSTKQGLVAVQDLIVQ